MKLGKGSSRPYSSPLWRAFIAVCGTVDRRVGWYRLPKPLGLLLLVGIRNELRRDNLHDTRIDWVESNSMRSVLLRHFPQLGAAMEGVELAFTPWARAA